jgi:membrane protease YdiL (CAAX protease family)
VSLSAVAVLLVWAPVVEEVLLRLGLQERLLDRWAWTAVQANAAVALLSGVSHALLRGEAWLLLTALPAWLIGWQFTRSRKLVHCVLMHASFNGLWIVALSL